MLLTSNLIINAVHFGKRRSEFLYQQTNLEPMGLKNLRPLSLVVIDSLSSHIVSAKTPFFTNCEPSYSNMLNGGDGSKEIYSRKVFVGGLPPDIDEGRAIE